MVKIGLIIDEYHLKNKVDDLVSYLKKKAEITYFVEESYLLEKDTVLRYEEDLFFVKGRGELMINIVKNIEKRTGILVINSSRSIWLSMHRFLNSLLLQKAGINVPEFSLNPINSDPPFSNYIIKNIVDQKNYAFHPKIEKVNGETRVSDERALKEAITKQEEYYYYYYQKFIESKWEYKIYGVGEDIYFYKQLPVLVNPNKIETRQKIKEKPELRELASKAMETMELRLTSMDFLKSEEGIYYLTDINSVPNFNYMKDGYKIVGDFLLQEAKN